MAHDLQVVIVKINLRKLTQMIGIVKNSVLPRFDKGAGIVKVFVPSKTFVKIGPHTVFHGIHIVQKIVEDFKNAPFAEFLPHHQVARIPNPFEANDFD